MASTKVIGAMGKDEFDSALPVGVPKESKGTSPYPSSTVPVSKTSSAPVGSASMETPGGSISQSLLSHAVDIDEDDVEGCYPSMAERLGESVLSWFRKRNSDTLKGALAFVPWVLQDAYFKGKLTEDQIVVHRGAGAVVFSNVAGFTALTACLARRSNGADMLSQCLTAYFTPLIQLINDYRGDVIKFAGNALTVLFPDVDDTRGPNWDPIMPPHGTYGLGDLGPMATSVLRASACCIEIHKRLHMFDTGIDDVRLCLHIGVGCGEVSILQVGGVIPPESHVPRFEFIIVGQPLEQISIAEPLAKIGETCLSPQAWEHVKDCVVEGPRLEDRPDFHLLLGMEDSKFTFPTIKFAAQEYDNRMEKQFRLSELNIIRQYIPWAVFKQIECGTLTYVNEMRNISVIFINGSGLDARSEKGPVMVQELVTSVQKACYSHEGTLNKFLIDDKGMLFLLVFGLPPLVHTDDPTRAVLSCFDMVKVFKRLGLVGRFGITTSRSYCGVCGSAKRMEYTVLGDTVNLAAMLMQNANAFSVLCDEETKDRVTAEIVMKQLAPIRVKGNGDPINIFQPAPKEQPPQIGLSSEGKIRFPWYDHSYMGDHTSRQNMDVQQLCRVKAWSGIVKMNEWLGNVGDVNDVLSPRATPRASKEAIEAKVKPPLGSPFTDGGVVVLEGPTGIGKVELVEHLVTNVTTHFNMKPVFGTMGPRPGDSVRLASEMLRSVLGVYRNVNTSIAIDDFQALKQVVPPQLAGNLGILRSALNDNKTKDRSPDILETTLDVVSTLLTMIVKKTPIIVVMQLEWGTSLFPKTQETDQKIFWKAVNKINVVVQREMESVGGNPLTLIVLCKHAIQSSPAVRCAYEKDTFMSLTGLAGDDIVEYLSNYLNVPDTIVPAPLQNFIANVTLGNPLYIRETIDQLQEEKLIQVNRGPNGMPRNLVCDDFDKVNVAMWQHTSMVGGTICLLESLDPLEAAVLKMSTCFSGPFTLPDLAARMASKWADATYFDNLRLFKALQKLVERNVCEIASPPKDESLQFRSKGTNTQYFQTRNLLIRAVGSSMVLEQQRKSVKRQALIDRVLSRDLPARMEVLAEEKGVQHIPWYYEQAFKRM